MPAACLCIAADSVRLLPYHSANCISLDPVTFPIRRLIWRGRYVYAPDHTTLLAYDTELGADKTLSWTCTSSAPNYVVEVWTLAAHPTEDFQITGTLIGTAVIHWRYCMASFPTDL